MKIKLPLLLISLPCMTLSGCAQLMENLNSIGQETPKNAPPGYHSFELAKQSEKQNDLGLAATNYCTAAELGHPQAKAKCIEFSFRAAVTNPLDICGAREFDKKAKQLCGSPFRDKTKAEIKAVVNQYNKKKMKARIQSGEFQDFKAEEF